MENQRIWHSSKIWQVASSRRSRKTSMTNIRLTSQPQPNLPYMTLSAFWTRISELALEPCRAFIAECDQALRPFQKPAIECTVMLGGGGQPALGCKGASGWSRLE